MKSDKNIFKADLVNSAGKQWNFVYGNYFSDVAPLEKFWKITKPFISLNKQKISIVELGSANANLCQFFVDKIKNKVSKIESLAVDAQKESVKSISKNLVKKAVADIAMWHPNIFFDIVLMRAVLHYNSFKKQEKILKNTANIMNRNSIFFNQLLSGDDETIKLYQKIQDLVFGRKVLLLNEKEYLKIAKKVFKEVKKIGDCLPIKITAKDMLDRFSRNKMQRKENWVKLQKISGWKNENEAVVLQFPVFKHKI